MKKINIAFILFYIFKISTCQDWIVIDDNHYLDLQSNENANWYTNCNIKDDKNCSDFNMIIKNKPFTKSNHDTIDLPENVNPRQSRPIGFDARIRWAPIERILTSVSVNYFIIPQIELGVNLGTDLKYGKHFSIGSLFHLNTKQSDNRYTPFSGLLFGVEYGEGFLQIPAGINYLTNFGFETSLSLNYLMYINSWKTLFAELKIGWRFKK